MAKKPAGRKSTKGRQEQRGKCELCGNEVTRGTALQHLVECAPAHDVSSAAPQAVVALQATSPELPLYWIDFEAKAEAKLEAIDAFLRRVWLECCGHLSVFRIDVVDYFSRGYEFGLTGGFGGEAIERSMNVKLRDAMPFSGRGFEYEYDFGSTTGLQLGVTGAGRTKGSCRSSIRRGWECAATRAKRNGRGYIQEGAALIARPLSGWPLLRAT